MVRVQLGTRAFDYDYVRLRSICFRFTVYVRLLSITFGLRSRWITFDHVGSLSITFGKFAIKFDHFRSHFRLLGGLNWRWQAAVAHKTRSSRSSARRRTTRLGTFQAKATPAGRALGSQEFQNRNRWGNHRVDHLHQRSIRDDLSSLFGESSAFVGVLPGRLGSRPARARVVGRRGPGVVSGRLTSAWTAHR